MLKAKWWRAETRRGGSADVSIKVLRDQFFDFYPVLDCEFSWPLQITRLTFSPSKVLESFAIPVVSTAKGAHNDTPTIQFHTTLRPTKMMTAHRRRRPTGQAFYLTVFAISLLAAFSLLRSLSGESAAARNSQFLEARMLEQKVKEVWLRPNIYNTFTDWDHSADLSTRFRSRTNVPISGATVQTKKQA
jgi:hypothetical protein